MEANAKAPDNARLLAAALRRGQQLGRMRRVCEAAGGIAIAAGVIALLEEQMPVALSLAFIIVLGGLAALGSVTVLRRIERLARVLPRLRPAPCRLHLHLIRWIDGVDYAAEVDVAGMWTLRVEFEPPERRLEPLAGHEFEAIAWVEPQWHSLWAVELPRTVLWVRRQVRAGQGLGD